MIDQAKFMETLRAVAEIARVSQQPLSKEDIIEYFKDMELSKEQQEMVYQYILHPQKEDCTIEEETSENEDLEEISYEEGEKKTTKLEDIVEKQGKKNSKFLDMYLEDISAVPQMSKAQENEAYIKLIDGDKTVIQKITDHWLHEVVTLSKEYDAYDVNIEDVIQEGNIGMLSGIQQLLGSKKIIDVSEYLKESVQQSIMSYIDEMNDDTDWESTVIAKTTLINEAKKALAKEMKKIPTMKELSEFTKMPEQEISDILSLAVETGKTKE